PSCRRGEWCRLLRIGRAASGGGYVPGCVAGDSEQSLGLRIVRLDVVVREGPLGARVGDDVGVVLEVALAETIRRATVVHRLAAHAVPRAVLVLLACSAHAVRRRHGPTRRGEAGIAPALRPPADPS